MEQSADLVIHIQALDADEDSLSELGRELLSEIRESVDVEHAELLTSGKVPKGAKAGGIEQLGSLSVTILPIALPALVAMLKAWMARPRAQPVKMSLKVGSRSVEAEFPVGGMSQETLDKLTAIVGRNPGRASQRRKPTSR